MKKFNVLISTFFGNGYVSKLPGTFTSLSTLIILYIIKSNLIQFKNHLKKLKIPHFELGFIVPRKSNKKIIF